MSHTPLLTSLIPATTAAFQATWAFLVKGGFFMIPLSLCSVIGIMVILYKFLSLTRERVVPAALLREVEAFEHRLSENNADAVVRQFQAGNSTLARLCAVAIKNRNKPVAEITQCVESAAREEAVHLHSGIGVLDVLVTVAPLLGLLGSASGLVVIFEGLGETTDHVLVAHGIAVALHTTIFGIVTAVVCVVAHSYFIRRIEKFTVRLESLLGGFVHACVSRSAPLL
ncbi:MAG: MotA/TolQ/ExbB proton channel family protein [Verrucomicrobia bacterium]|nr:MAG: MotA/TolQ/ExbB proton channel family protein [Verrucomicrobiota bacterium]